MKTTRRFSPKLLERFLRLGRGQGVFGSYVPWHRVGRGDPASRGRSHLLMWHGRQIELLSDLEWVTSLFIFMLPGLVDLREQFPLSLDEARHELLSYRVDVTDQFFPGTRLIAAQFGFKHPQLRSEKKVADWIMSTDFVITLRDQAGRPELLAVAVKSDEELASKRKRELLQIEREYWRLRNVAWLLIAPSLYDKNVALNLRMQMPWALGEKTTDQAQQLATEIASKFPGRSLTFVLDHLAALMGDMDLAQRAFWQAVLRGKIRLNLSRGWRPHQPLQLMSEADFLAQNPIASRRSAWI